MNKFRTYLAALVLLFWTMAAALSSDVYVPPMGSYGMITEVPMMPGDVIYREESGLHNLLEGDTRLSKMLYAHFQKYHPGIYLGFAYPDSVNAGVMRRGLSYTLSNHAVAEANRAGSPGPNINGNPGLFMPTYQQFRDAGPWIGAKTWKVSLSASQRRAIIASAITDHWLNVSYVDDPESQAIKVKSDVSLPLMSPAGVSQIRDDTYVEMVYSLSGNLDIQQVVRVLPPATVMPCILTNPDAYNNTKWNDERMDYLVIDLLVHKVGGEIFRGLLDIAKTKLVLVTDKVARMIEQLDAVNDVKDKLIALTRLQTAANPYIQYNRSQLLKADSCEAPAIEVRDSAGHKLADNAEVSATNFQIYVNDGEYGSGIRLLEIWKGNPASADSTLVKSVWTNLMQGTTFYDTSHTYLPMEWYSASSPSGYLNYGRYYARAFDNAGNFSLG